MFLKSNQLTQYMWLKLAENIYVKKAAVAVLKRHVDTNIIGLLNAIH